MDLRRSSGKLATNLYPHRWCVKHIAILNLIGELPAFFHRPDFCRVPHSQVLRVGSLGLASIFSVRSVSLH